MALNRPDEFHELQESLRSVVPAVKRIRFDRAPVSKSELETITIGEESVTRRVRREYMGDALVFDMAGAPSLPAHLVSEGTVLVLGVLGVLLGPVRPRLALIDDLGQGLHPKAQGELVRLMRALLGTDDHLQIVATTQSPYLLDHLRPGEVRLTTLREDGSASCASLTEHPDFGRWKDEMTPGEMWSLFGEKWVGDRQAVGSL
jgi:predicted ATPase